MAVIYATLIVKGRKTFGQVPDKIKDQVRQVLVDLECEELITESVRYMKMKKDIICAIAGMAAAAGVKLFGGWTPTLSIVLILMGLDLIAGFLVAVVFKKSPKSESGAASSNAMLKGMCKKFMMVCLLAVAHQLDVALGVDYIMLAATYGFIANEALSIVENAGLMGIVKSDAIVNAIEVLKGKSQKIE